MKSSRRRKIFIAAALLLLAGAVLWQIIFREAGGVENWVGGQLQLVVNHYLNPQLQFESLQYTYPATVRLKKMRLEAPASADEPAIDILSCESATITLAEIPRRGKPILIERIELQQPVLKLVSQAPGSGRMLGWSHLVRRDTIDRTKADAHHELSDVLRMRQIDITDGQLLYDPRLPGTEPMQLNGITTRVDLAPTAGGSYHVEAALHRPPLVEAQCGAEVDLDKLEARNVSVSLQAGADEQKLAVLPPQLQRLLADHEVRGVIDLSAQGEFPLRHLSGGAAQAKLSLHDANVRVGNYRIPVQQLDVQAHLADGKMSVDSLHADALRGMVELTGAMPLSRDAVSDLSIKATDLRLEDLLASKEGANGAELAGKVSGTLRVVVPIHAIISRASTRPSSQPATLPAEWGAGSVQVTDARLVKIRLLNSLNEAVAAAARFAGAARDDGAPRERANIEFTLRDDHAQINDFSYAGEFIAARGAGSITLDQHLYLTISGGPIEKMQDLFGAKVSAALSKVTDKIVRYKVNGTIHEPQVEVEVAGGAVNGIGKALRSIGEGIGNAAKGIGDAGKKKGE